MSKIPQLFGTGRVGTCIKKNVRVNSTGKVEAQVVHQNSSCKAICGEREFTFCSDGCMASLRPGITGPLPENAIHVIQGVTMGNTTLDAALISDTSDGSLVTFLCPTLEQQAALKERLLALGLSARETEVALAVMAGNSRAEIASRLSISKATLKTHLNNLYRKLPPEFGEALKARSVARRRPAAR
ncbi:MAG: helix-turn-helix transcriptional regulator [Bdellovibrionales bacterium]|nr:helix-turn-helix transcriptional regulator [Bdellovibrionales bacterium]